MSIRKKLIILSLGSILVLTGSLGSFAYLKSKDSIKSNVETGAFPRCKVKIYASVGPLYNNCILGKNNKESEFYKPWLNNANKYIKDDIIGKKDGIIGQGKTKFENIKNNNKNPITAKAIIGTYMTSEHSWMGKKEGAGNENGSMIHYLVAISNGANEGAKRKKLDFQKSQINIKQRDIFKTNKIGKEYPVYRERCLGSDNIALKNQDKRRIRTYNWDGKEYVQNGGYGNPSHVADLIIFDIGNNVYFSMEGSKKGIQKTYNMLTGKEDIYHMEKKYDWKKVRFKHYPVSNWSDLSSMYDISLQMYLKDKDFKDKDSKGRLIRSECSASYTYNEINRDSSKESYVINIGD